MQPENKELLTAEEFTRLANNFYMSRGLDQYSNRISIDAELMNHVLANISHAKQKAKVAFVCICLNTSYWEFAKRMIEGARQFFLPGHETDFFLWSDIPEITDTPYFEKLEQDTINLNLNPSVVSTPSFISEVTIEVKKGMEAVRKFVVDIRGTKGLTIFPTEPTEWPFPTLMRYHLFLQQEEILSKYDYIFYCDVDMVFTGVVGDEILGHGLTAAPNPMYYLHRTFYPPYEPNEKSTAYIKRPGQVVPDPTSQNPEKKRFMPQYYAGGFQGGKSDVFIKAMKVMRKNIDLDFANNYIAIWNEESHWNRYLFENPPEIYLNPSYIYPDSLIEEYYKPRWGRDYVPKLVTVTKKQSLRQLTPQEQEQMLMMKPK